MPPPEGRVLANLDEFMLRVGHLSLLADVAAELGGNEYRVLREFSDRLTELVEVPAEANESLARYLRAKSLCDVVGEDGTLLSSGKERYSELVVRLSDSGPRVEAKGGPPRVWWQDLMLSDPRVESRVGAVTVSAKSGSRTGVSHIFDWAVLLDLLSRNADLQPEARLVGRLRANAGSQNPYVIGAERLVYAWAYVRADFDVFSRFAVALSKQSRPLKRRDAASLFAETVVSLTNEAEQSRLLSNSQKRAIYDCARDLERAAKGEAALGASSTAWHRTSSRVEVLVDLGLLSKGGAGSPQAYEYYYLTTPLLAQAARTLDASTSWRAWVDEHFVAVFGPEATRDVPASFVEDAISEAASLITAGSPLLPIEQLSLALAAVAGMRGFAISLSKLRQSLLTYARDNPDVARLSSGRYGREAEFISVRHAGAR